jgi:hypothetical protein
MLYLYTWLLEPFQTRPSHLYACRVPSTYLLHLALPPQTEGLVDPEFPGDGEEGHNDGDAANVLDHQR